MNITSTEKPSGSRPYKELDGLQILSRQVGNLCKNKYLSDVVLNLQGQSIPAHKRILACRAEYFKSLFFGGFNEENTNSIDLEPNTPLYAFSVMLLYIYTGKIKFDYICEDELLELLILSDKYQIKDLEEWVLTYLIKTILKFDNVSKILVFNELYDSKNLHLACINLIDYSPITFLKSASYSSLSAQCFNEILSRDSFSTEELNVFLAAKRWTEANPNSKEEHEIVLSAVRLHHIATNELIKQVWHSELVSSDTILKVLEDLQDGKVPPKRNPAIRNATYKPYKR